MLLYLSRIRPSYSFLSSFIYSLSSVCKGRCSRASVNVCVGKGVFYSQCLRRPGRCPNPPVRGRRWQDHFRASSPSRLPHCLHLQMVVHSFTAAAFSTLQACSPLPLGPLTQDQSGCCQLSATPDPPTEPRMNLKPSPPVPQHPCFLCWTPLLPDDSPHFLSMLKVTRSEQPF